MRQLIVGVKYCGHCNPTVEGPQVIEQIGKLGSEVRFVSWESSDKDVLLIFSGCATDCVSKPDFSGPVVHVAGYSLEHKRVLPEELPGVILHALREKKGHDGYCSDRF